MTSNFPVTTKNQFSPNIKTAKHIDHRSFGTVWTWWHAGAALGLLGGLLAGIIGFFLAILKSAEGNDIASADISRMATILIVLTIPMMMFGAVCLDKIEDIEKARRIEYCKQHGMTDEECK